MTVTCESRQEQDQEQDQQDSPVRDCAVDGRRDLVDACTVRLQADLEGSPCGDRHLGVGEEIANLEPSPLAQAPRREQALTVSVLSWSWPPLVRPSVSRRMGSYDQPATSRAVSATAGRAVLRRRDPRRRCRCRALTLFYTRGPAEGPPGGTGRASAILACPRGHHRNPPTPRLTTGWAIRDPCADAKRRCRVQK